jgi:hypothetical protein
MVVATLEKVVMGVSWAALRVALLLLPLAWALAAPQLARAEPLASFSFSPSAPFTSDLITFVSTSTGVVEPQRWDLDGDRTCDDASGPTAQRSFDTAGVYMVTLCVTDGFDSAYITRRITVYNRPPVADFTYAPLAPLAGDALMLTSISADPDGPIVSQAWDLNNDGAFDDATGPTASLPVPTAGSYIVRLKVIDRDGAATVAAKSIAVAPRPPEPLSPFPIVRMVARVSDSGTRISALTVETPAGAKMRIRCRGPGCPFHELTRTAARTSKLMRILRLRRHMLRPGAVVQIWVTKPKAIGKYTRFRIRRGMPPSRADRCVMPGAKLPARCPLL